MQSHSLTAGPADKGKRLDLFLTENLPQYSRSRLQSLIKESHVLVNDTLTKAKYELLGTERITLSIPPDKPADAQPQELPLEFLYLDASLAVLNKASGMVVHPGDGTPDGTVVNALLHRFGALSSIGGVTRPGIVHRLDKETSGCLAVARTDAAHQSLSEQFASRTTQKIYLAVVQGIPKASSGSLQSFIGRHPVHRQKMAVVPESKGKHAHTDWRVLSTLGTTALVECTLHTGRTHQIRVHLRHLGHPLLGDQTYGARPYLGVDRVMLHAWKLCFTHPSTQDRLSFQAPIPECFSPWLPEGLA